MTVTLTYDATLARVRINADGLAGADLATVERSTDLIQWTTVRGGAATIPTLFKTAGDTFSHNEVNGWGVAEVGGRSWVNLGGVAADHSVSGGTGRISITAVNSIREVRHFVDLVNGEAYIDIIPSVLPLTSNHEYFLQLRIGGSGINSVDARIVMTTGNTVQVEARQFLDGVVTASGLVTVAGATATTPVRVKVDAVAGALKVTVWPVGTTQPAPQSTIATNVLVAGRFNLQVRLNTGCTNTLPVLASFDNFECYGYEINVDDYEWVDGAANNYRVRGIETGPIVYVTSGAAATGNSASLVPALPNSAAPGTAMFLLASIRNSGTGTPNTPTDWGVVRQFGNAALFGRVFQTGVTAPTVSFSGGVANADTLAQIAAFHRASILPVTGADQLNGSAQNVNYPALTIPDDELLILLAAWKQDDTSGVTALAGATEVGEASSIAGDDASQALDAIIQGVAANIAAGTFTFGGGAAAISRGAVVAVPHADFLNEQTAAITPVLDSIWLKSITRPFLNRKVTVVDWTAEERPSRNGGFPAVGRTLEVAVADVAGGLTFDLDLYVSNQQDAQTLDYIRASGDILFVHTPAGCPVPGGHVCLDTTSARRIRPRGDSRVFTLPLRQCAAPGPDVVGATSSWTTVLNSYASWPATLAANPAWPDLVARIAPPSEVIVP